MRRRFKIPRNKYINKETIKGHLSTKNIKRYLMIFSILLLTMIPIIPIEQTYAQLVLKLDPTENSFTINNNSYTLENKIFIDGKNVFIPLREVFTKIGYKVEWDGDANAVVCTGDGRQIIMILSKDRININSKMYNVNIAPFSHNDTVYISTDVLKKSTGLAIELINFTPGRYNTGIDQTVIDDSLRSATVQGYGSIRVAGTRAMEALTLVGTDDYAALISQTAAMLPDCTVYNMIVPTGAEYYAEADRGIKDKVSALYQKFDPSVVPINVFGALEEHKGENIYFRTDHHWTQRGAYYAYKKLLEYSHREIAPLSDFPVEKKSFVGSFANFLSNTAYGGIIRSNPDEIEYFMPTVNTTATVYSDRWLTNKMRDVSVVAPINGYLGFIGGDAPVTVIKTDCEADRKLVIVKESYGNTIATWAVNNYREIYVVDPRHFNSRSNPNSFKLADFYNYTHFDDILFINYPGGASSPDFRNGIRKML